MKVILAGMSKTGTKSMAAALTILGFNVHDTMQHFRYHRQVWYDFVEGKASIDDLRKSYEGVDAVTDQPTHHFWDQMREAFPESKIILTSREEESWVKSVQQQLKAWEDNKLLQVMMVLSPTGWSFFKFLSDFFTIIYGYGPTTPFSRWQMSNINLVVKFREHNAHVLSKVSKEKLLIFDVKEGWGPLCEFLNLEVPNEPFPRRNVGGSIVKDRLATDTSFQRMKYESLVSVSLLVLVFSILMLYIFM